MPRFAYVNGRYLPHDKAAVHIEDRGYQLADGVYEAIACIHGHLADERGHLDRLERSLSEIGMDMPLPRPTLKLVIKELLRKNRLQNANVYIQVTRGRAKRDFPFPDPPVRQSLVLTTWPFKFDNNPRIKDGIAVYSVPDIRWKRRDIKSLTLLPQVLAKQSAVEKGGYEAWMVDDDGYVTEGASSNTWIIDDKGTLITRPVSNDILQGVTRTAIERLCKKLSIPVEERLFTVKDAQAAAGAFTSSAVALVMPVVSIDDKPVGNGRPHPVAERLYGAYRDYVKGLHGDHVSWESKTSK